jgi:type II secretory pathway component PulJ
MSEAADARQVREQTRARERAVWTGVEQVGRDLRQADTAKQVTTQADSDATRKKPKEGMGA